MSNLVDNIEKDGLTANIYTDCDVESPREYECNIWNFVSLHRNIVTSEGELTAERLMECRESLEEDYIIVPVYMYEHSGISLSLKPFYCPFDSGVGFIAYIAKERVKKEYGDLSEESVEKAMKCLEGEVKSYSEYLNGECFCIVIEDEEGNEVDSCGGFLGYEYTMQEAERMLDENLPDTPAEEQEQKAKYA